MSTKPSAVKKGNIVIIDPNPVNHVVEHEDLFIYASLKAKTKGRTFLTEDSKNDDINEISTLEISTVDLTISDSAKNKSEKRAFLSSNWTEIGGSQFTDPNTRGDLEGFGITNIDIKMEGSYIPVVTINFVDVRGATLFEQGSCSPYGLFFHLPYPIFELTLKGYYGKPVTYYLNLVKFDTKFNPDTGNFEAKGEFIGWSYAFLADILMGFVRCASYMENGWDAQKKLRTRYDETMTYYIDNGLFDESDYYTTDNNRSVNIEGRSEIQPFCWNTDFGSVKCMTVSDLLKRINNLKDFLGKVKTDDEFVKSTNLSVLLQDINAINETLNSLIKSLNQEPYKSFVKQKLPTTAENINGDLLFVFNGEPKDNLLELLKVYFNRPIKGNDNTGFGNITASILTAKNKKIDTEGTLRGGNLIGLGSQTNKGNDGIIKDSFTDLNNDNYKYDFLDVLKNKPFQKGMLNSGVTDKEGNKIFNYEDKNSGNYDYYIDLGYIKQIISDSLNIVNTELESKRNFVKEEIDKGVTEVLGFRPTIRNIFTILSCNVENFMHLLLDCSIKAEEYHSNRKVEYNEKFSKDEQRIDDVRGSTQTDEKLMKNVYPWPTYYKTKYVSGASYSDKRPETKEVYPGDNIDFIDWVEVKFIDDFIEACKKVNREDEQLLENKTGLPGFDNYTPINPLESKVFGDVQLKYRSLITSPDATENIDVAVKKYIAERMFITMDFSYYDPIRLNLLNFGMGRNIPSKNKNKTTVENNKDFNEKRNWFNTLYRFKDGKYTIVESMAKIDADNLLSCIDDDSILQKLNLEIESSDFKSKIESVLKGDNTIEFKIGVDYTDIHSFYSDPNPNPSPNIVKYKDLLKNVLKTNIEDISSEKYWSMKPKDNRGILLLGNGSDLSLGDSDGPDSIRIYPDIRKMKQDHLFQLIDEDVYKNLKSIIYKDDDGSEEGRENLNRFLSDGIKNKLGEYDFSKKYINYSTDDKNKTVLYDGGDDENGKKLFTTLNIGVSGYDQTQGVSGEPNFIDYAGLPTYVTNLYRGYSGAYLSGYQDIKSGIFPFSQQTYQSYGNGSKVNYFENANKNKSSEPQSYTLELPGRGIFKDINFVDLNNKQICKGCLDRKNITNDISNIVKNGPYSSNDDNSAYKKIINETDLSDESFWNWANIFNSDTLVQLPIWLDNVNNFRKATTIDSDNDGRFSGVNGRQLTNSNYQLKTPPKDGVGKDYTSEQIQNRNLAYLFLASCKPTPFITCGTIESGGDKGDEAVFNDKAEHYPKSIIPFLTSQGLVKIPKVWVYGIGSVLWRWKMYMGVNKDGNGNIIWRHPALVASGESTGQQPIGLDPLAQPGHPGYSEFFDGQNPPMSGKFGRKNRNFSVGVGNAENEISYTNRLFKNEKSWISTNISDNTKLQTSCFASSTLTNVGLNRSLSGGEKNSGATYGDPISYRIAHGCNFDYWGVYNSDETLIKNGIPNDVLMPKRTPKNYIGGSLDNISKSPWTTLYFQFVNNRLGTGFFGNQDPFLKDWGDNYKEKYNPLDLGFRNAKEASTNTFWPLLWITPWQHFYTEPVNSKSELGPKLPDSTQKNNSIVEKTLTFIPMDHQFRDYVGNFGALGDQTNNYSNRDFGGVGTNTYEVEINKKFMLPNTDSNKKYKFRTSYITGGDDKITQENWFNLEGGRYTELIALLPTFVKERFVEEFENWVDSDWKNTYLKVVDPVNFGECKTGCLGESYRAKPFITKKAFDNILGYHSAKQYTDPWEAGTTSNQEAGKQHFFKGGIDGTFTINSLDKSVNSVLGDLETQLFDRYYYAMVSTPRLFGLDWHDYNDDVPFYANEKLVDSYLKTFQARWKERYQKAKENLDEQQRTEESDTLFDDVDIKLSLYRTFKSITDKWISSTTDSKNSKPNFFFNITDNGLNEKKKPLAAHFSYVNRVMGDIGNKAVLDVFRLKTIPENPKISFYNLISDLLGENKFDFFPLPTFTNFTNTGNPEKIAEEMFSPYTNTIPKNSGPNFICMYVGGTSRVLDLKPKTNCYIDQKDMNYNNDGFGLLESEFDSDVPYEFKTEDQTDIERTDKNRIENLGSVAFRVAYGLENQNMFKSVQLDQTEFSETNESLMVIDRLANGGDPSNRTQKGNNLHNIYLTRSYTCTVESLGNMMIQPLQYFDLTNIPMFHGTYLITKVSHNVKPHHINTSFTGVRQPIATVPIVEDVATAFNASLKDIEPIPGGAGLGTGGSGGSGGRSGGGSACTNPMRAYLQNTYNDSATVEKNLNIKNILDSSVTKDTLKQKGISISGQKLLDVAIEPLLAMCEDLAKYLKEQGQKPNSNGTYITIGSTFRSNQEQTQLFNSRGCPQNPKGCGVAKPGRSNHEWGIAVDFNFYDSEGKKIPIQVPPTPNNGKLGFESLSYEWLFKNSAYYGWISPKELRDGGSVDEFWHFEYAGKGAIDYMEKNSVFAGWGTSKEIKFVKKSPQEIKVGFVTLPGSLYNEKVKNPIFEGVEVALPECSGSTNLEDVNGDGTFDTDTASIAGCPNTEGKRKISNKAVDGKKAKEIGKKIFPELSNKALSGLLGHLQHESNLNPTAYNSDGGGCGAYGLAQWRGERFKNLEKFATEKNKSIDDFELQLEFVKKEMSSTYIKVFDLLKNNNLTIMQYTAISHISYGLGSWDPNGYYNNIEDNISVYKNEYLKRRGSTPETIPKRYANATKLSQV